MSTPAIKYKSLKADPLTTKSPVGVLAEENSVKQRFFFLLVRLFLRAGT
jgi:hypothetical protein